MTASICYRMTIRMKKKNCALMVGLILALPNNIIYIITNDITKKSSDNIISIITKMI